MVAKTRKQLETELEETKARLAEAEETLRAIQSGEIDALVVDTAQGSQVFTLQDANHPYRVLVQEMSEGALTLSLDGVILFANQQLADLLGLPLGQVVGAQLRDFVAAANLAELNALLAQDLSGPVRGELSLRTPAGEPVPVLISLSPLQLEDTVVSCIVTDLREQKHIEAIMVEERLSRAILEQVAEAIVVCDRAGVVIRASRTAHDLCPGNPLRRSFDEAFPLHLAGGEPFSFLTLAEDKNPQRLEVMLLRNAEALTLWLSFRPLVGHAGEELGCVITMVDITNRKQIEEALRASEENHRITLDSIGDAVIATDIKGHVTRMNPVAETLTGWKFAEAAHKPLTDVFKIANAHTREPVDNPVSKVLQRGGIVGLANHTVLLAKDGREYQIADSGAPIWDGEGHLTGVVLVFRDVTEEYRMRERIAASEARYRTLFETAREAIVASGPDGKVIAANSAAAALLGYDSPAEMVGARFVDAYANPAQRDAIFKDLMARGYVENFEATLVKQDGSGAHIYILGSATPHRDKDEQIVRVETIFSDITERKQAEQALQESEERFKRALENIPDVVVIYDAGLRIRYINSATRRLTGRPISDFIGKREEEIWPPEVYQTYLPTLQEALDTGEVRSLEADLLLPDGRFRSFNITCVPLLDKTGKVREVLGITHDLTERKRAEESLRQSEKKYRLLFENMVVGTGIFNTAGQALIFNEAMSKITGYTSEEYSRLNVGDIYVNPEDRKRLVEIMQRDGMAENFEAQLRHKAGKSYWASLSSKPIRYEGEDAFLTIILDITERKQAEQELQFRSILLNAVGEAVIATNLAGEIIFWNKAAEQMYGWQQADVIGRNILEITPLEEMADSAAEIMEQLSQGNSWQGEFWVQRKDGGKFPALVTDTPLYDDAGNLSGILGVLRDITELKRAEEVLRESEAALRKAQRVARVGSWTWHIPQNRLEWSDEMYRIFGLDKETFTGHLPDVIARAIHPDDRAAVEQANLAVIKNNKPMPLEYRVLWPDATVRTVWAEAGELMLDDAGNALKLTGIVQDITKRKRDEDALRLQSAALNAAANAILITDRAGIIQWVNPAFCELTGYSAAEAIGKNPRDLVKSGHHDRKFFKNLWDTILAGQVWRGEIINRRKDGDLYQAEETITPVQGAQGEISHFIAIKQDVTSRKALEEENEKLAAQFYQAQKMEAIGQLAGGIAHDFNNLLVPIMGFAELGQMKLKPNDPLQANFSHISQAAERAANLTRQILAFSRQQVLETKLIDLNQVITDFQKMLSRLLPESINLRVHLNSQLRLIKADQGQLEQVLLNLVVNARDAMPDGGVLTIETNVAPLDEAYAAQHSGVKPGLYVLLAVSDTGRGMDAETQQRIFEPFFTTKERGRGTGLGLATVFGIVRQHEGNIWVYSELGQGATFKVYLPVAAEFEVQSPTKEDIPVGQLAGGETVLVVEDEAGVRQLVVHALQAQGYTVLEAATPAQALELVAGYTEVIHLLLTDVVMPGMNGRQLYAEIALQRPDLKVLFMSGYTDNVIVHHGALDPGVAFVAKPFSMYNLLRKVREVIGGQMDGGA